MVRKPDNKASRTAIKRKIYILDTNVLIHDPQALYVFPGEHIGIPIIVVQELDHFKDESSQRGRNAREAIRSLDKLREKGSLSEGVEMDNKSIIQVLPLPRKEVVVSELPFADADNQIIVTGLHLKFQGYEVHFISKDLNMRVKADALGLMAQDYKRETVSEDEFYKGWVKIEVPAVDLKRDDPDILIEAIDTYHLSVNEYVLLQGKRYEEHYRVFRYLGDKTFRAVDQPRFLWPITARNPQQLMALDLLMDDSIQLVCLFGPAGTGKTFLTLVAALHKLLIEHIYKKILIARPVVSLGKDIGFLPGDIQEKLYSWMQPIRDNMEFIMHKSHQRAVYRGPDDRYQSNYYEKQGKGKKRHGHGSHSSKDYKYEREFNTSLPTLDDLVNADKVSLEAITYMRGRSIPYQYIFIDEVQNLTPHEVKTLVTRVGEGSKIILAGDPYQIDSPYLDFASNGLVVSSDRFKGQSIFGTVFLETSERSKLSQLAADLL